MLKIQSITCVTLVKSKKQVNSWDCYFCLFVLMTECGYLWGFSTYHILLFSLYVLTVVYP